MPADALDHALTHLVGDWWFTRVISGGAQMSGTARFSPVAEHQLRYAETGTLTLPDGKDYAFERRYIYELFPGGLRVLFDESPPRLFQSVDLAGADGDLTGTGFHDCPPDTYVSSYRFTLPAGLRIAHEVAGPRKAHTIITDYARPTINRSEPSK